MPASKKTKELNAGNQKLVKKAGGTVKVKWVVSFIACTDDIRQTIRGLGLRRLHQVVERQDTPETRGMIHKVRHLVEVVG
jgi:large subunit ribosomal protein L30